MFYSPSLAPVLSSKYQLREPVDDTPHYFRHIILFSWLFQFRKKKSHAWYWIYEQNIIRQNRVKKECCVLCKFLDLWWLEILAATVYFYLVSAMSFDFWFDRSTEVKGKIIRFKISYIWWLGIKWRGGAKQSQGQAGSSSLTLLKASVSKHCTLKLRADQSEVSSSFKHIRCKSLTEC